MRLNEITILEKILWGGYRSTSLTVSFDPLCCNYFLRLAAMEQTGLEKSLSPDYENDAQWRDLHRHQRTGASDVQQFTRISEMRVIVYEIYVVEGAIWITCFMRASRV